MAKRKKKDKQTNNYLQNITPKRADYKPGVNPRAPEG